MIAIAKLELVEEYSVKILHLTRIRELQTLEDLKLPDSVPLINDMIGELTLHYDSYGVQLRTLLIVGT